MKKDDKQKGLLTLFTQARAQGQRQDQASLTLPTVSGSWRTRFDAWFRIDPRALAIFRVTYGILLMIDVLRRIPYTQLMYSKEGVLPNKIISDYPFSSDLFSVLLSFDGPIETRIFFYFAFVAAFLFTIGFKTRLFHLLSAACLFSVHTKNILVENGGDQVMNIMMMWSLFLPLGKRLSIDSLLKSLRKTPEGTSAELNDRELGAPSRTGLWNIVLFACLCQIAAIYFFNTVSKSGPTWRDGTALFYVLHMDRQITEFAVWSRANLPYGLTVLLTWGTLLIEGSASALILSPIWVTWCRRLAVVLLTGLHLGIAAWMNVGLFSWAMICAYPLLFTPEDMDLFRNLGRRFALGPRSYFRKDLSQAREFTLEYPGDSPLAFRWMRILKRADRLALLQFQEGKNWVLRGDKAREGFAALGKVLSLLPFGYVFLTLFIGILLIPAFILFDEPISAMMGYVSTGFVPYMDWPQYTAILTGMYVFLRIFFAFKHQWLIRLLSHLMPSETLESSPPPSSPSSRGPRKKTHSRLVWTGFVFAQILGVFLMLIATRQMLATNDYFKDTLIERPRQYSFASNLLRYPRMFNKWNMFAPNPPKGEGWIIIDGCTMDNRNIDIQTNQLPHFGPVSFDRGVDWGQMWRIYTKRIAKKSHKKRHPILRDWLKGLHRTNPNFAANRLKEFDVYWMRTASPSPNQWYKPVPEDHWTHRFPQAIGSWGIFPTRNMRKLEATLSSWARNTPRVASGLDEDLYDNDSRLKPRRTCYKVTSHHPKTGKRMRCKKPVGKSVVPKICQKKEPDKKKKGRGKGKASKKRTRPNVPKARTTNPSKGDTEAVIKALRKNPRGPLSPHGIRLKNARPKSTDAPLQTPVRPSR